MDSKKRLSVRNKGVLLKRRNDEVYKGEYGELGSSD
jgi:hypothetical protein